MMGERTMAKTTEKRWKIEDYLPLYLQAAKDGVTREEFADQVGLKPLTVYQKANSLRTQLAEQGIELPELASSERTTVADKAAAIIAAFGG
jgi:chromosome segregation and condensation protein ScpB